MSFIPLNTFLMSERHCRNENEIMYNFSTSRLDSVVVRRSYRWEARVYKISMETREIV